MTIILTTPPPVDRLPEASRLRHALRLLESAQTGLRSGIAADVGVGVSELAALEAIRSLPEVTPKMLSIELGHSTGAVTALLDRLTSIGLLERIPNLRDRRSVLLRLTDAGETVARRVDRRYEAISAEVLSASPGPGRGDIAEDIARTAAVITAHTIS